MRMRAATADDAMTTMTIAIGRGDGGDHRTMIMTGQVEGGDETTMIGREAADAMRTTLTIVHAGDAKIHTLLRGNTTGQALPACFASSAAGCKSARWGSWCSLFCSIGLAYATDSRYSRSWPDYLGSVIG